ncbi:MAG: TonB-dependent receptor plug domain-containing protein [Sphingobium sp.]
MFRKGHMLRASSVLATAMWMLHAAQAAEPASGAAVDARADDAVQPGQPAGAGAPTMEEIVVTARRREEALQDVPITITALTAEALASQNVTSSIELSKSTPSLTVVRSAQGGNNTYVQLRGIGGSETLFGQDQTVGIYVNEVPQARQEGGNLQFFDLQNVQILYGPQGTLFGRNSVAGAIVYQTNRPTDKLEGSAEVELGNYATRWFTGMINVPVAQGLSIRGAVQIKRRHGFITEVNSGEDLGNQNSNSWRISVRAEPAEGIRNDLIISGFDSNETYLGGAVFGAKAISAPACSFSPLNPLASQANPACYYGPGAPFPAFLVAIGAMPPAVAAAYASYPSVATVIAQNNALGKKGIALTTVPVAKDRSFSITDILEVDLGSDLVMRGIFGYRDLKARSLQSGAGYALPVFDAAGGTDGDQYSGEVQLQGSLFANQLDFTAGAFYFQESGSNFSGARAFAFSTSQSFSPMSNGAVENKSTSLYAQTTFRPSGFDRFSLTTGLRYTWDRRQLTVTSGTYPVNGFELGTQTACSLINPAGGGTLPLASCSLSSAAKFDTPTWLVTADYKLFEDTLVYATYSRGYRSGGFNVRSIFQPNPFGPETVDNYEIGIKSTIRLGDVPLRLNADYWRFDYKNIQSVAVVAIPGTSPVQTTTDIVNSDTLKLEGAEVDISIEPARGLTLRGFLGYVSGHYPTFKAGGVTYTDVEYGASKISWGANLGYETDLGSIGRLNLSANYSRRTGSLNTVVPSAPQIRSETLGSANFRVGLSEIGGTGFSLAAFARNVGDAFKAIPVPGTNLVTGGTAVNYTEPTYYGVDIGFKF